MTKVILSKCEIKFKKYMTKITHSGSVLGWCGEKYIQIRHMIWINGSIENCSGLNKHNNNHHNILTSLLLPRLWYITTNLDTIQWLV